MTTLLLCDCVLFVRCETLCMLVSPTKLEVKSREHSRGDQHIDVDCSPIIEDLYSPELGFMDICATSMFLLLLYACVEVMTTLHGSTPSLRRHAEGCTFLAEFPLPRILSRIFTIVGVLICSIWVRILGSELGLTSAEDRWAASPAGPPQDGAQYDRTVSPPPPPSQTSDRVVTWDDFDGLLVVSLPTKFKMPDIEQYTGIGCHCIHLRIYKEGITRGLWSESSPSDSNGKKPLGGQRPGNVGVISSTGLRPLNAIRQLGLHASGVSTALSRHTGHREAFCFIFCHRAFSQLGMPLSQTLRKLAEARLLTALTLRPPLQPVPPQFRMDLHCAYHQGPGHKTDRLAHSIDFTKLDDHIHMLS
ncbi:hypothetical protein AAG906_021474 [Vitis piasezkii]